MNGLNEQPSVGLQNSVTLFQRAIRIVEVLQRLDHACKVEILVLKGYVNASIGENKVLRLFAIIHDVKAVIAILANKPSQEPHVTSYIKASPAIVEAQKVVTIDQ
jgi:hypothetical protein